MNNLARLLWVLAAITLWRILTAWHVAPELFFDEAQYWDWAQTPAWGYYSKPPMLAWIIALSTTAFGDSEMAIRAGSFLLYPFSALFIFLATRRLIAWQPDIYPASTPFWAAVLFISLPFVSLGSWLITTDAPLLFFWSSALFFFVRVLDHDRWRDWLGLGLSLGLGMLSKYVMGFFAVCALAYVLTTPSRRAILKTPKPYVAAVLALAFFAPNLAWNQAHQFASFKHTAEISQLDRSLLHPKALGDFFVAQFGVFGPLSMLALLAVVARARRCLTAPPERLLIWFTLIPLAFFLTLALLSRSFANWAAFSYIAATPLVTFWLIRRRRWLQTTLAVNLIIAGATYHYHDLTRLMGVELTRKNDPYHRIIGWRAFGEAVSRELERHPGARLVTTDRQEITELLYYARPRSRPAYYWNLAGSIHNHYALMNDIRQAPSGPFLIVGGPREIEALRQNFEMVEPLPDIVIPIYRDLTRRYSVFLVRNYKPAI